MKNLMICMLLVFGIAGLSSATAGNNDDKCTKTKTLTITLPDDENEAPEADPSILCVKKNSTLKVVLSATDEDARVRIVFLNGKTPIGNGNSKEKINKGGKSLKIKNSCRDCEFEYKVYDATKDSQRPPLDPVIIIER
jgi:hypothetical protein